MYWLETRNTTYSKFCTMRYEYLHECMVEYHRLIKAMMNNLPEEQWFDLKLMRHGKDGDFMPERDHIVRSWVY